MVLLALYRFGASFQCFCLCRRLVVQAVHVPSNILCTEDQPYDRLKMFGRQPLVSGGCRGFLPLKLPANFWAVLRK